MCFNLRSARPSHVQEARDYQKADGAFNQSPATTMRPPEHQFKAPNRPEKHEEDLRAAIDALVTAMTWVGREISLLKSCITSQNASNLPLHRWEPYTGYSSISVMVQRLDEATIDLRDHVTKAHISRSPIFTQIAQARAVSTDISNASACMMKIMSEKMDSIEIAFDDLKASERSHIAAYAFETNMFIKETRSLIKYTSSAAESVWAALDMLQVVPSIAVSHSPYDKEHWVSANPWTWKEWMVVMIGLILVTAYITSPHLGMDTVSPKSVQLDSNLWLTEFLANITDENTGSTDASPVTREMKSLQSIINETLRLSTHAQDAWLEELQQRDQRIMEAIGHTNERLDNMWEALGPPNENGTYMTAYHHDVTIEKRFKYIMKAQQVQDVKNKAKLLELKRQLQLFEVRAGSRLSHLERKQKKIT